MGSPGFSDHELLKGLISREENVLREYYVLFYSSILKFVRSNSGNEEDARDLFQDAMLVLFQKARSKTFRLTCSPGTYLYSVSRHLWYKELAKRKRVTDKPIDEENLMDPDYDIIQTYEKNERLLFFRKCFDQLPEDCRKVLELFIKGFSISRITGIMGYSSDQQTRNRRYNCKMVLIKSIGSIFE